MNAIKTALTEPLKTTTLGHIVIVTVRRNDPHSLRPFATVVINDVDGKASCIATYATEIAALLAHDTMIKKMSGQSKPLRSLLSQKT